MTGIQIPLNKTADNRSIEDRFVEWYIQDTEPAASPEQKEVVLNLLTNDPELLIKSIESTFPQLVPIAQDTFKEKVVLTTKTAEKIVDALKALLQGKNTTE
jgi:hypothetical protein